MDSLGREPAGGSESWPRPGIAGHRPLAGYGASRRLKAVRSPRKGRRPKSMSRGAAIDAVYPTYSVAPPGLTN